MMCLVCGAVTVPGARFCHMCGAALAEAASLPATERRVVTVLFGDLSDFTAWAEDLDPERVGAVTDRVLAALARSVTMFGGHVDKLTGDGIMAVFGAPVAHEDDPERAVRAALSMQRAVRRVLDAEQGGGVPLGLRVGLNTGMVVAGVQAALEYTVIGDTVNTAARLADAAAVGTVYAGEATVAATRHRAAWRRLRPLRLKGKREPVQAFELLGLRDAPGTRSGLGDEAPFVGREAELGRFASRLAEVGDRGEARVLMITAEAGVGKTRFAAEAGRYAGERGARVLSVRCVAYGEHRRLAPLADLVRSAAGFSLDDPDTYADRGVVEERLRRLAERFARAEREAQPDRHVSGPTLQIDVLLTLLGFGDRRPSRRTERPTGAGREVTDAEVAPAAVAELLSMLARESPLVVVVDDLQDATTEALDALGATIARLTGPILVLLLGRPELVRTAGVLTRMSEAEAVPLSPLRGADAARLLSSYLGGGKLPPADENRLLATAQGNPFYLAELVTLLVERGLLTSGPEQQWRLAPGSLSGRLLSRDLAAVLAARIDALPPQARAVLRDAAVVGDTIPEGALEALQDGPTGVAAVEFGQAIDELLARRMLRRRTRGGYAFVTPLMRQAAYSGLGKAVLAIKHAQLARWGARKRPRSLADPEADSFVAEHAERAISLAEAVGLRDDAETRTVAPLGVAALTRMARRSLAAGEPTETDQFMERAAALAGGTLSATDRLVHARALLQLGRMVDARAIAEKVAANAEDPAIRREALLLAGEAHRAGGDLAQARRSWQEALDSAVAAADPSTHSEALCRLGMLDYLTGQLSEAERRFEAAYQIAAKADDRRNQAWALQHLAWVTTTRGDFAASDDALGRAARLFTELDDVVGRAWLRGTTAFTRLFAGRLAEARRIAYTFLPFGERVGDTWAVGTLRAVAGFAAAELGHLTDAEADAKAAYRAFDRIGDDWGRSLTLMVRGAIARGQGDPRRAVDFLDSAEAHGTRAGHWLMAGLARTMRGYCHLELGDAAAAEQDAHATLEYAHDMSEAAQVGPRALLAAALRAQGDLDGALKILEEVTRCDACPSLLFARRQAIADYADCLLEAGRVAEALEHARRAVEVPAEDVRSGVAAQRVLARALAEIEDFASAREVARAAVELAYATEQVAGRAASDALLAALSDT